MSDPLPDDVRRRIERIEQNQSELSALMRENVMMSTRQNEIFLEVKESIKELKSEQVRVKEESKKEHDKFDLKFNQVDVDLANLKLGFGAVKWLAGTIGGGGLIMALTYLFQGKI